MIPNERKVFRSAILRQHLLAHLSLHLASTYLTLKMPLTHKHISPKGLWAQTVNLLELLIRICP